MLSRRWWCRRHHVTNSKILLNILVFVLSVFPKRWPPGVTALLAKFGDPDGGPQLTHLSCSPYQVLTCISCQYFKLLVAKTKHLIFAQLASNFTVSDNDSKFIVLSLVQSLYHFCALLCHVTYLKVSLIFWEHFQSNHKSYLAVFCLAINTALSHKITVFLVQYNTWHPVGSYVSQKMGLDFSLSSHAPRHATTFSVSFLYHVFDFSFSLLCHHATSAHLYLPYSWAGLSSLLGLSPCILICSYWADYSLGVEHSPSVLHCL